MTNRKAAVLCLVVGLVLVFVSGSCGRGLAQAKNLLGVAANEK